MEQLAWEWLALQSLVSLVYRMSNLQYWQGPDEFA